MKLFEISEPKPLRIFTHVSEFDLDNENGEETHLNWVVANMRMADTLAARDYDYRCVYSQGFGQCDEKVYQLTEADTLVWMWDGYTPE